MLRDKQLFAKKEQKVKCIGVDFSMKTGGKKTLKQIVYTEIKRRILCSIILTFQKNVAVSKFISVFAPSLNEM